MACVNLKEFCRLNTAVDWKKFIKYCNHLAAIEIKLRSFQILLNLRTIMTGLITNIATTRMLKCL